LSLLLLLPVIDNFSVTLYRWKHLMKWVPSKLSCFPLRHISSALLRILRISWQNKHVVFCNRKTRAHGNACELTRVQMMSCCYAPEQINKLTTYKSILPQRVQRLCRSP
jgi:hypothetical protein